MAKARSKKKAKSGSKTKAKPALKKKPALKARSARMVKAKKPAPKKKAVAKKAVAKKAVAKKAVAKKAVAKKAVARKVAAGPGPKKVTRIVPKATPVRVSPRKPLAPEVDRALMQADVEGLISRLPPPVQPVVKTLRRLVLEAAPEASELLEDGSPAYFANGVFARIVPSERSVLVKFLRGGHLPSAAELTSDGDGGESRSISLSSIEDLKETVLRKIVREAVMLNMSTPVVVQA